VSELNNNNRGSSGNNRRRGRNNNRPQGGGGNGQQLNRIDSRARGNASQLLEKYRKMAQDAHLNGDRVQAEYYLQFADHYFRVSADSRVRQDEQRQRAPGERWQEGDGDDDNGDFSVESDFPAFDRPANTRREEQREPREQQREVREPREQREQREPRRFDRQRDRETQVAAGDVAPTELAISEGVRGEEGEAIQNVTANPFVRDSRGPRNGLRPRGERRPRRDQPVDADAPASLDPSSLPPAIGARAEPEAVPAPAPEAVPAPETTSDVVSAPKRRGRPRKTPIAESPEAVEG
jgi:hypothetical protein